MAINQKEKTYDENMRTQDSIFKERSRPVPKPQSPNAIPNRTTRPSTAPTRDSSPSQPVEQKPQADTNQVYENKDKMLEYKKEIIGTREAWGKQSNKVIKDIIDKEKKK